MLSAVRIVTFLNASLQSLDKTARVLSADGNLRKVLAPFGKNAPKTDGEKRALAHAYRAWAKISALGVLGLGLRMLYADDPEYEEISDQLRATHWILKVQGKWTFIPKPFELATISNILERAYEAGGLKDPTAAKRLLSDMSHTIAPPHEIPALSVPFAVARNRDYRGAPIVPEHLRGAVDPEYQFNSYTSKLGRLIGRTLNVSPAVVDYVITGFGGSLGRYALQGANLAVEKATGAPATDSGPEDYFLSRAFIRDASRGSTSQKAFWEDVSKSGGRLTTAEGTFRQLVRAGDNAKALDYLNELEPRERAYVKDKVLRPAMAKFHPMDRAQKALAVITDMRRDARAGTLIGMNGRPIALTPSQRREVDDALSHMAMAEMRNALIATGAKGWAQKSYMPIGDSMERLAEAAPPMPGALREALAAAKVPTIAQVNRIWTADQRARLERPATVREAAPLIDARRLKTTDKAERLKAARDIAARRRQSAEPPKVRNIFASGGQ